MLNDLLFYYFIMLFLVIFYKKLKFYLLNKMYYIPYIYIRYFISFYTTIYNMSCLHRFIQIENRSYPKEIENIVHQCSKCGLIDKTMPNEIHIHSDNNMSFIGQSIGY